MYKFTFNKPEEPKRSIGSIILKTVLIAASIAAAALAVYAVVKKIRDQYAEDALSDMFCDEEDCANCEGCDIDVEDSDDDEDDEEADDDDDEEEEADDAEEDKDDDAQ